jgi:2-polyprenyl-3-methyl-5-hydroxy-6-metoxy-1,4-benzoquinol methylase
MAEYNKYVFETNSRTFEGKFEEMYQHEMIGNFDSWHQDDSRQLNRKIALEILSAHNFKSVIDVGSGKGMLTHQLKRLNNNVLGLDISQTTIEVAHSRFPGIGFGVVDVSDLLSFERHLDGRCGCKFFGGVV